MPTRNTPSPRSLKCPTARRSSIGWWLGTAGARERPPGSVTAVLDHLSIQCDDAAASARFYDAVLAAGGGKRLMGRRQEIRDRGGRATFLVPARTHALPERQAPIAVLRT